MVSEELARRGHEVTIAAPPGQLAERARAAARGLPSLRVCDRFRFRPPSHAVSFARDAALLRALVRETQADVVDVHGSQDAWVAAVLRAATGIPRRLVLTRHNTKRVRDSMANRWLYRRIDHLIVVDESVLRLYEPFFRRGDLDRRAVSVIPSAYRAAVFHAGVSGTRVRAEIGAGQDDVVVGVAGRLVPDKGHIFLMRAAASLRGSGLPRLLLAFAGLGPAEPGLREAAASLGLQHDVRFLGFRPDIAEVQAAFDIAVLPSVGCDASSASLKEAMALGVPVIASDIGGARAIVDDGLTGTIVPPGDAGALASALRSLLADRASAGAMAGRARAEVARRFSIARLADGTLAAYTAALEGRGARPDAARGDAAATGRVA
jgi:glycosyltransferase involved in cell wall biosynthesis